MPDSIDPTENQVLHDDEVLRILTTLTADQRIVIAAALINHLSYVEIAARFGMSGDQVKRLMREALESLRQAAGLPDGPSGEEPW